MWISCGGGIFLYYFMYRIMGLQAVTSFTFYLLNDEIYNVIFLLMFYAFSIIFLPKFVGDFMNYAKTVFTY